MTIKIPNKIPEINCFYYHYKHDPSISVNNYAYEVIGVGMHSEDDVDLKMQIWSSIGQSMKVVSTRLANSLIYVR
jgi:hypothetical protein